MPKKIWKKIYKIKLTTLQIMIKCSYLSGLDVRRQIQSERKDRSIIKRTETKNRISYVT